MSSFYMALARPVLAAVLSGAGGLLSGIARLTHRAALACAAIAVYLVADNPGFAQTCPAAPASDDAKSHKLFLYFPTTIDRTFPPFPNFPNVHNVTPAQPFDVGDLDPQIGTTSQLIDEIRKVVVDDYCEFNIQVLATTTNPAALPMPPPRRVTVAIGSDANKGSDLWGQAQEVDLGDKIDIDFARIWGGTYTICEGGLGPDDVKGGCSQTGSLMGSNSTLERWAQAIGGSAAHEAGHTYGLAHSDDDPPIDPCKPRQAGPPLTPGEDAFNRHLMPAGCNLTGPDRVNFRRHFSNRDYGILATNVGLSVETMHNWELVNPNAENGSALVIDFLSPLSSVSIAWSYSGPSSPWLGPTVSGVLGTAVFKGKTYNKFKISWSGGNSAWNNPSPGIVAGGAVFHVGATFTGVDFNQPDPIIIQDVTLLDASSAPLALHPRLPSYDAGTLVKNQFVVNFFAPESAPDLQMVDVSIQQLPQLASIDSLMNEGHPLNRDALTIAPWAQIKCGPAALREGASCVVAPVNQRPHVQAVYRAGQRGVYNCRDGVPLLSQPGTKKREGRLIHDIHARDWDGRQQPNGTAASGSSDSAMAGEDFDDQGPVCAGVQRDPFPSAVVYVVATFVDPNARHFDPGVKNYVEGPVISKVYYQFAGIRRLGELPSQERGGSITPRSGKRQPRRR